MRIWLGARPPMTTNDSQSVLKTFVINLDRRPDRWRQLATDVVERTPFVLAERVSAIDGKALALDGATVARIEEWYRVNVPETELRGILGAALSHLEVWRRTQESGSSHCLVLEDDAVFVHASLAGQLKNVTAAAPVDAGLIWLNEYLRLDRGARVIDALTRLAWRGARIPASTTQRLLRNLEWRARQVFGGPAFRPWRGSTLKSTEAYLITPQAAELLSRRITHRLGPIDVQMMKVVGEGGLVAYELVPPLFDQRDRKDSNIR